MSHINDGLREFPYLAVRAAFHEVLDPRQSIGSRTGSRSYKFETLGSLRLNVLVPEVTAVLGVHVGLPALVRSINED